jgi:signal transduction histidine kinase
LVKTVGLKTEILITLTLLLGAALLLGGIMSLHLMERALLEERIDHLDSLVHILSRSMTVHGADSTLLRQLPDAVNCDGWWLYDQNDKLIDSQPSESGISFPVTSRQLVRLTGELQQQITFPTQFNFFDQSIPVAQYIVPIKNKTHLPFLMGIQFSLVDVKEQLDDMRNILLIYVFLYGVVLIFAGYFLLQRNVIKPVQVLFQATENVRLGDFETRLPDAGPKEISQLAVAYNQMVDSLRDSRAETEQHIASLEETNKKLQQVRDELIRSEKMASVGQLAAGLAHELGNPLAALIGYLEILKLKVESASDQDIIDRSLAETNRIDFLVRELLDFSRPGENLQTQPVHLVRVLRSSIQLLQNQGTMTDIKIIDELSESIPFILGDPNKFQQVFVNLLLNAVQACQQKGEIMLLSREDEKTFWIGIEDNGIGIAENDLHKIFEPFYTTKISGEGTGLGLAICQHIVEESGGIIYVESVYGGGSLFKLLFKKDRNF